MMRLWLLGSLLAPAHGAPQLFVLCVRCEQPQLRRGAQELVRHLYLQTGALPALIDAPGARLDAALAEHPAGGIVVSTHGSAPAELGEWRLGEGAVTPDTHVVGNVTQLPAGYKGTVLLASGASATGTMYACFTLLEHLGVRFRIDADIVSDQLRGAYTVWNVLERAAVAASRENITPILELRGLQPFHDFSAGPDWWNEQEYRQVFEQMSKMKMNFLGIHNYPISDRRDVLKDVCNMLGKPEPSVWIGLEGQFDAATGAVRESYRSTFFTTWGFLGSGAPDFKKNGVPMNTSDFRFGAAMAYSAEDFSSEAQMEVSAGAHLNPAGAPSSPEESNALFNKVAALYNRSFSYGRGALGMKIAIGTETPLARPPGAAGNHTTQEYYEGTFKRIVASYPVDYYWLWTPEGWEWQKVALKDPLVADAVADLQAASAAHKAVGAPFKLATCGWVLGPLGERNYLDTVLGPEFEAMSSIEEQLGWYSVDPSYSQVHRAKWSIPWMEDDEGLGEPQFWVERSLQHGYDALQMGVKGLMGIHWRTRELSLQISAIAQLAWARTAANPRGTLSALDVYLDLCTHDFGLGEPDALALAAVFASHDSFNQPGLRLPKPDTFLVRGGGCSGYAPNGEWKFAKEQGTEAYFAYVDSILAFQGKVRGPENLARFRYWAGLHELLRAQARAFNLWGEFEDSLKLAEQQPSEPAAQHVLALRLTMVKATTELMSSLMQSVSSTGALGTLSDFSQRGLPYMFDAYDARLERLLKKPLPEAARLPAGYQGEDRMFALTPRGSVAVEERWYNLSAVAFTKTPLPAGSLVVHYRWVEQGKPRFWNKLSMDQVPGRQVYRAALECGARLGQILEWTITAGSGLVFPAGGKAAPFTVTVLTERQAPADFVAYV